MDRLFARERVEERSDPVPARDQAEARITTVRMTTRVATPRPNAPLLIRIVRYPFVLAPARGSRARYLEETEKFVKIDWSSEVAAALAERERLRFTSAGRGRPRPFAVRPSTWTLLPPDPGDER